MESPRQFVRNIRRALGLVWQSAPGWTALSIGIVLIQGLLPLLVLYLMKLNIDAVTAGLASPDKASAFRPVLLILVFTGLVAVVSAAMEAVATLVAGEQGQLVTDRMHQIIHRKAVEVDLEYYEHTEYYDALHRAEQEALFRPNAIVHTSVQLLQNGISLLGIVGLIVTLHWGVAAVVFLATLPGALVRLRNAKEQHDLALSLTPKERQAHYLNTLLTGRDYAKELRLFGLGPLLIALSMNVRDLLRGERRRLAITRASRELGAQVAATLPLFAAYVFIAERTLAGAITLGGLVMYYQALQRGQSYLRSLLSGVVSLFEHNLFLTNLYQFLDLKPMVASPPAPAPVPNPMRSGINFEQVSFRYPGSDRWALQDVSFVIHPGEVIALVGENGSGKSTLVKLLCRLYDPDSGRISLDGLDLQRFPLDDWRRQISVVFQDYVHYHFTARENIWFGNTDLPLEDPRVVDAARRAGADEVITKLSDGYDTYLGKWLRDGAELSIGQWQKIALARGFIRDAQVLILDEPTSALDPKAEYEVFEKFREMVAGRTAVLISHRLSTVKMADRIYVLQEGRIVEGGTHDELIRKQAVYARLFEAQARSYR